MQPQKFWTISKKVLPQHTDHAGVAWHGSYLNWLEEARVDALSKVGKDYGVIIKDGFELPVIELNLKYFFPFFIGEQITINSYFQIKERSPKIKVRSELFNSSMRLCVHAEVLLVLVKKNKFKIVRNKPEYISNLFRELSAGPNVT